MKNARKKTTTRAPRSPSRKPLPFPRHDSSAHPCLVGYFTYCFYKSGLRLRDEVNTAFASLGVIAPQCGILTLLETQGPLNQNRLGAELGIDKATMVRMLDGLETLGAVERVTGISDRRVKTVRVTGKGRQLLKKADLLRRQVEERFLSVLSKTHQEIFRQEMPKLLRVDSHSHPRS